MLLFQMRLDVYGLLCEQQKLTESVSATDLQLVDYFLSTNLNNQEPAFRQSVLAATKKVKSLSLFFLTCQLCLNSIIGIIWIADWNVYKVFVGFGFCYKQIRSRYPTRIYQNMIFIGSVSYLLCRI